jgi:hypothetical protein
MARRSLKSIDFDEQPLAVGDLTGWTPRSRAHTNALGALHRTGGSTTAIGVVLEIPGCTRAQYHAVIERLGWTGGEPALPNGLIVHSRSHGGRLADPRLVGHDDEVGIHLVDPIGDGGDHARPP